jgi:hypothetical protein
MFFLNFGDGHAGGVCSETNYTQANQDGAWVGLERYPHPTDSQYSWVSRMAEIYSARTKNLCRHNACIETILKEVRDNIDLYNFDECFFFIGLPNYQPRLFPIYGSWGNAKNNQWSTHYRYYGLECQMDGNDFNREEGHELILNVMRTGGIRPKDTTYTPYIDMGFRGFLNVRGLNPDDIDNPLNAFHPDNPIYHNIVHDWLTEKEKEYLKECERISKLVGTERYDNITDDLISTIKLMKKSSHQFFFYFTDQVPGSNNIPYDLQSNDETETEKLDHPNQHWFWGVSMANHFNNMDNSKPRFKGYYKHEDHLQFSKYMRHKLTETKKML